ncbi:MAG TPA: ribosomal protein S18-alanine N-acetyltransferase [Abditibacteriaceae bacterium]|nr:ribosomal protein S18-alanine N-acetyltransferase [Abditibacteriaceae bacterium]
MTSDNQTDGQVAARQIEYSMVSLRPATRADLRAICAIDQSSFTQPWQPHTFEQALNDAKYIVLVAQSNEIVCGFGVAYTVGDEGEIATFAVDEAMRGQGVGDAIFKELMAQCTARGAQQVFLEVRQSNQSAQRLYKRFGFEVVGQRHNYYSDGETALIMKR